MALSRSRAPLLRQQNRNDVPYRPVGEGGFGGVGLGGFVGVGGGAGGVAGGLLIAETLIHLCIECQAF
jgi:hypothetical protein